MMNDFDWQPEIKDFKVEDWKTVVAQFIYWCDHGDAEALDVCCETYLPYVKDIYDGFDGDEPTEDDVE